MSIPPPVLKAVRSADKYLTLLHGTTSQLGSGNRPVASTESVLDAYYDFQTATHDAIAYLDGECHGDTD